MAIKRSGAKPDEKAVVFGCGPIWLGAILWLRHFGVDDVVAIELHR